jgi:ParB/RepB/Spo0J family partition protein
MSTAVFEQVPMSTIVPSPTNPRKHFDQVELAELARSIKEVGIIEPIIVRPIAATPKGQGYEIVAGERRWRAANLAELPEVAVIVRPLTDTQVLEIQVIENLQRRDLHPLEEAGGYHALMTRAKYDAARIAERLGKSAKYVYDRVKLLDLIDDAKKLFMADTITAGHAILLARLEAKDQRRALDTFGALFTAEQSFTFDQRERSEPKKAVSVREFDGWISKNVRFDHAKHADPMLFPETAMKLDVAKETKLKIVPITFETYLPDEARDGKTFFPASWKRADGQEKSKTCEHAVLGVVVAGGGRGEAFNVCVSKEKCKTHWAQWQKDRDKRAAGQKPSTGPGSVGSANRGRSKAEERYRLEDEKRQKEQAEFDAFKARFMKAAPAIATAFAERIRKMPTNAASLLGQYLIERFTHRDPRLVAAAGKLLATGKTADDLVRFLVFLDLYGDIASDWQGPRTIPPKAKAFGIDFKRLLDEVAPAAQPKAAVKEEKPKAATTTKAKAKSKKRSAGAAARA